MAALCCSSHVKKMTR
ncbi:hypothetical protein A2U01_0117605, partial [Trifolium medium]|nr:hypothetical protein [Trifolium medium]